MSLPNSHFDKSTMWALYYLDMEYLDSLMRQLYLERRLNGDDMRDIANRLYVMLNNAIALDEDTANNAN